MGDRQLGENSMEVQLPLKLLLFCVHFAPPLAARRSSFLYHLQRQLPSDTCDASQMQEGTHCDPWLMPLLLSWPPGFSPLRHANLGM